MNLQTIQEKLNIEFGGSDRKLVFWYDDHGEFAEEIDTLDLPGAKIHMFCSTKQACGIQHGCAW